MNAEAIKPKMLQYDLVSGSQQRYATVANQVEAIGEEHDSDYPVVELVSYPTPKGRRLGDGDGIIIHQEGRRKRPTQHLFCGCCCDMRTAVVVINILSMVPLAIFFLEAAIAELTFAFMSQVTTSLTTNGNFTSFLASMNETTDDAFMENRHDDAVFHSIATVDDDFFESSSTTAHDDVFGGTNSTGTGDAAALNDVLNTFQDLLGWGFLLLLVLAGILAMHIVGIVGAMRFHIGMVTVASLVYMAHIVLAMWSGSWVWTGLQLLFLYPHLFFIRQVRSGKLSQERYVEEQMSCCCCV